MLPLVDAVARYVLAGPTQPALWAIKVRGRAVGLLVQDDAGGRLTWLDGADPRLVNYAGPLDGEVETLAEALSARLGRPVELESLPG